jgi:hypothetical protein
MSWQFRTSPISVGDPVRFSTHWLRSIHATTGDLPHARGVVTELKQVGKKTVATVDFHDGLAPMKVLVSNLSRVAARGEGRE